MNKTDLVNKIAELTGITKADADKAIDAVTGAITAGAQSWRRCAPGWFRDILGLEARSS